MPIGIPDAGGHRHIVSSGSSPAMPDVVPLVGEPSPNPPSRRPIRFDEKNLWPTEAGLRMNPSILPDGDGYLFAVRTSWTLAEIVIGRLDADFRPAGPHRRLKLEHSDADLGQDDPRLFRLQGQPHVSFAGQSRRTGRDATSQLFARLSADGTQVEEVFAPHYPLRRNREKNWSFFEHDGELYTVYCFTPCRVLKIVGNSAIPVYETPTRSLWQGGEIRGGASPVRVGDELWCFFHDRIYTSGQFVYRTGLLTLDGQPPFRVRRMLNGPILIADRRTKPANQFPYVVFPGGAVRCGNDWIVAHGIHDLWIELHWFSHTDLESRLVTLRVPRGQGSTGPTG
ncbi:MAG TPA: hypothetical protein VH120_08930 [Gemmataceae bacterium]|nr:hypothetical protein [Gemmataceae bacterium]